MKGFLIALQFLTILPVKIKSEITPGDSGRSLVFFPIVGMLIGALLILILYLFGFLPYPVVIVLILAASIFLTGGIHLDGFADTCDGLFGIKTKERALEIMRDSHVGTMAVVWLVILLLLKFTLLISVPKENLWRFLLLMPMFGRWTQVLACSLSIYAREQGKAKYFIESAGKKEIFIATLYILAVFLFLMRLKGLIILLFSLLPVFLCINYIKNKIGGMTGDTIGAVNEISEVALLFFGLIFTGICL